MPDQLPRALETAAFFHKGQALFHPLAVASHVLRFGGSEAQAVAALLHDTIGSPEQSRDQIKSRFSDEIASLVYAFQDPRGAPESWRGKREAYLAQVREVSPDARFVIICEELQCLAELLMSLRLRGTPAWKDYPVHNMEIFWYFREVLSIAHKTFPQSGLQRDCVTEFSRQLVILQGIVFEGNLPTTPGSA